MFPNKSIIDYIDNPELQDDLRVRINQILKLTIKRNKISNDLEIDPAMKEDTLFVLEDSIRAQTKELPDLQGIIATYLPGKAMRSLVFLLTKAAEDTRRFNKQAAGTRSKERVKILANLNSVLQIRIPLSMRWRMRRQHSQHSMRRTSGRSCSKMRTSGCLTTKDPLRHF